MKRESKVPFNDDAEEDPDDEPGSRDVGSKAPLKKEARRKLFLMHLMSKGKKSRK